VAMASAILHDGQSPTNACWAQGASPVANVIGSHRNYAPGKKVVLQASARRKPDHDRQAAPRLSSKKATRIIAKSPKQASTLVMRLCARRAIKCRSGNMPLGGSLSAQASGRPIVTIDRATRA